MLNTVDVRKGASNEMSHINQVLKIAKEPGVGKGINTLKVKPNGLGYLLTSKLYRPHRLTDQGMKINA